MFWLIVAAELLHVISGIFWCGSALMTTFILVPALSAVPFYLVFKVLQRLGRNWRALNGGPNLMQLVLAGAVFKDGSLQQWPGQAQQKEVTAA